MPNDISEIDLAAILGAAEEPSKQQLALYIPNKDYVDPDRFERNFATLREFLHRFGRETNQGEVVFEFDGELFRVGKYDQDKASGKGK